MKTFSSCQGHYGEPLEPEDSIDRSRANVRAYYLSHVPEGDVEDLILWVLTDYMESSLKFDAHLRISKEYLADPRKNGVLQPLEKILVFELYPFDPDESNLKKRRVVNKLIKTTTASVHEYITNQQRQKSKKRGKAAN